MDLGNVLGRAGLYKLNGGWMCGGVGVGDDIREEWFDSDYPKIHCQV